MKIKCQECNTYVDIDENEYEKEVEHSIECPLCSSDIHFTIHKEKPKVESEIPVPPIKKVVKATKVKPISEPSVEPNVVDEQPKEENVSYVPERSGSNNDSTSNTTEVATDPDVVIGNTKSSNNLVGIIIGIVALVAIVGGYFYYNNVYLPEKIDAEAPRSYTFVSSLVMRSSKMSGADYNKVASLPYGTELITYNKDSEWADVKLKGKGSEEDIKGYVSSTYLLSKPDFFLLNSIFGNSDAKEVINTSKCRLALLNYFKEKRYIGKIDEEMRKDAGITIVPNSSNQWQVFTKQKDVKPNAVYFKKLINPSSKFTDFAVIITNLKSNEQKLLYFYFDDDETPHLATEFPAPYSGYIRSMDSYIDYNGNKVIRAE